jgi:hypothetical protein
MWNFTPESFTVNTLFDAIKYSDIYLDVMFGIDINIHPSNMIGLSTHKALRHKFISLH